MIHRFTKLALLVVASSIFACSETTETVQENVLSENNQGSDWVLKNGKILTVDDDFSIAEAMAISDGRIVATGAEAEIMLLAGQNTVIEDLQGKTVVPGLIDNHMHFVRATKQWYRMVRWDDVKSRAQALEMLKERAAQLPEGEWLLVIGGFVFDQFQDNSDVFSIEELDAVLPDRPLYIQEAYSRAFVNSAALAASGVNKDTPFTGRGGLIKNESGELTGELVGGARELVDQHIPEPSNETWDNSLKFAIQSMLSKGLTGVYDVGGNTVTAAFYESVNRVAQAGELDMRVFYSLNEQNSASNSAQEIMLEMQQNTPDLDGLRFAQFGYGETVYRPMRANPFVVSEQDQQNFKNIALTAVENGWQINEHSTRDIKVQLMLDILEEVAEENSKMRDLRFTIAHTNGLSKESIQRAIDLDMVFAVHSSRRQLSSVSFEAGASQPPARSINELGAIWGLGSDATTVGSPNPFHTIGWIVSGRNIAGNVYLAETVSREDALRAHTNSNAYILFREDHLGSLEPGKRADFVVLNDDYMSVREEELENLYSLMTVVDGEVVYRAP